VTLRNVFAGTTFTAIAIALVFGAVFAFTTSDSARGAALVGENGFEITFKPVCDGVLTEPYLATEATVDGITVIPCHTIIGPNGSRTKVGEGFGSNSGDFDLVVTGGSVEIRALHYVDTECGVANFGGSVEIFGDEVIPPGGEGGKFEVALSVAVDAPEDCQGQLLYYKVIVEAENP